MMPGTIHIHPPQLWIQHKMLPENTQYAVNFSSDELFIKLRGKTPQPMNLKKLPHNQTPQPQLISGSLNAPLHAAPQPQSHHNTIPVKIQINLLTSVNVIWISDIPTGSSILATMISIHIHINQLTKTFIR